jgi:hypothetical protein
MILKTYFLYVDGNSNVKEEVIVFGIVKYLPTNYRLSIQPKKDGKTKFYQVKQFLQQYQQEND